MNFHSVFFGIGLLTLLLTLFSLRRQHIRAEYSVSWLVVGITLTGLTEFPKALDRVAGFLGLAPEICFLIVGGTLISGLVFEISHLVSRLRDENVILAQRIAILEYQLREFSHQHGRRDN
jgi:hypothetical protein